MPTNPYKNTEQVNAVIKVRRGPEVDRSLVTYEDGELVYSTDKKRLFVGDGVGDDGTDGGNLVGNKLWISDSFNSENLPYIQKYDMVYRPSTTGFYILTGDSFIDPTNYLLVGGKELIPQIKTYTLPKATNTTLGGVIVKTGLTVDANGNLNLDFDPNTLALMGNKLTVIGGTGTGTGTGNIPNASYSSYGKVRIIENAGLDITSGDLKVSIDNDTIKIKSAAGADQLYVDTSALVTLPIATTSSLGGIIVSNGLKINPTTGELSLKTATDLFVGGIKTGKALSASPVTSELDVIVDNNTIIVDSQNQLKALSFDTVPIGTVNWFAASAVPAGYLECDGSIVSKGQYNELYSLIRDAYTSVLSANHFRLPDLRGEFIRGWDNGKGVDSGRVFGSNQSDEFKSHTHRQQTQGSGGLNQSPVGGGSVGNTGSETFTQSTGGIETRPRNVALLPCIKATRTSTGSTNALNFIEKPTGPTNGQVLTYNGSTSTWVASASPAGGGGGVSLPAGTNGQVLTYDGSTSAWAAKSEHSVLTKTSNFSITLNEVNSLINVISINDIFVAVPSNTAVSIPIGSEIVVSQESTGRAIFIPESTDVIINSYGSFNSTAGESSLVRLIKIKSNTWVLNGDIEPFVNVNNYDIYNINRGFEITVLMPKIANFDSTRKSIILSALNKWSSILKYTNLPNIIHPNYVYNGINYITNPLYGERFNGYVLVVNQSAMSSQYDNNLGYAGYTSLTYQPSTSQHLIPRAGYFIINTNYINDLLVSYTDSNITQLYYTALHEFGHALGIGTTWDLRYDAVSTIGGISKDVVALERSFVVGAGDTAITPFGSAGNIFYTIDRGNNSRGILDTSDAQIRSFTLTGVNAAPGAGFTFAYNTNHPIGNNSKAVYYYNQTFGTNLTAIPLENFGDVGSYGSHWPEGFGNFRVSPVTGADNRTYYGQSIPGAPAMAGELMSPNTNVCDMPISKITLGSLEDLGWSVDYNEADNYEPFKLRAKLTLGSVASANKCYIKQNNFGGWLLASWYIDNTNQLSRINYTMRRGISYTILNENVSDTLTVRTSATNSVVSTTSQTIDGIPNITFTVPTNATLGDNIVIKFSSDTNLTIAYRIGG